ncbi:efflux RND transporter periplasmic adaptor subunit [Telmatobacter sp. DSM 110680]|uniref:Efflux RND transporter periplasmic adaptor subunit n=1 Tax=Telmatobacter sp. DSM 110680 TaxID=3036704 RepID=A0AAU7DHP6_9BACT
MNARNRVFMILGLLTLGSLVWYLLTARTSGDLKLIGTVDANEVLVSAKIPGRIQTLNIDEGQSVKAGELIAVVESDDLAAQQKAAEANVLSDQSKLAETVETERQNQGEVSSASVNAEAQVKASQAALAQAQANLEHQKADTSRTVALAKQGIASDQARDEAVTSLNAAEAAVASANANVAAAKAALQQAHAHELLARVSAQTVASTRGIVQNAKALADQAHVELGYAQVVAPVSGKVNVLAARQGEVLAAGGTIATVMDLSQTWVYAPLPETQADSVQIGDSLKVVMPSGATVQGKVIAKSAEADFATQRDINGGRKRDIRTVRLKLLIDNPEEKFVPGMTAEVYVPKAKLVKQ